MRLDYSGTKIIQIFIVTVTTAFFLEGGKQCIGHKLRSLGKENN
jgi:hypothetical protein